VSVSGDAGPGLVKRFTNDFSRLWPEGCGVYELSSFHRSLLRCDDQESVSAPRRLSDRLGELDEVDIGDVTAEEPRQSISRDVASGRIDRQRVAVGLATLKKVDSLGARVVHEDTPLRRRQGRNRQGAKRASFEAGRQVSRAVDQSSARNKRDGRLAEGHERVAGTVMVLRTILYRAPFVRRCHGLYLRCTLVTERNLSPSTCSAERCLMISRP
jgi:hypothetical protein